jgi:hypothetical protein
VAEAKVAESAGADVIVAQGMDRPAWLRLS